MPIILGVNEPQYTPKELEAFRTENEKGVTVDGKHYTLYEATQRQRSLERSIRKRKRHILIDESTGDKEKLQWDQIRLVRTQQEYRRFSKAAGLREQWERTEKAGFTWKHGKAAEKAKLALEKPTKSDTIGLHRRKGNTGAFSGLPERMSKKHIRELAKEYGIDLSGLTLSIDKNEDLLRIIYSGCAVPERVGEIIFFPNAFISKEELLRTLYHERIHVMQFREFGSEYVQNNRAYFERLAYDEENRFIMELKGKGAI